VAWFHLARLGPVLDSGERNKESSDFMKGEDFRD
jgi:hypothetical protein